MKNYSIEVLLVDDQAIVGETVRRMLAPESGIHLHYCQDPTQAIPMALAVGATVILQDLVMPDIDGLALVRFFRAHPKLKDVPLIVLSSKEEPVTKAEAFALGANDYLVKLPDRIELVARIRYHSQAYITLLQRNEAYAALLQSQQELAAQVARATVYVRSLLPKPVSTGPIRVDWRFVPSTHLGGDSFGYHWVDPDHFAIYLLDVCGHGVGPALLSVSALNVLRSQSLPNIDFLSPVSVLSGMNEAFQMRKHNDMYMTLWYAVYHAPTRRLKYCSGGHPPPILVSSGTSRQLSAQNMVVGGIPGIKYEGAQDTLTEPGTLYLFSDGCYEVELPNEEMWSLDEFQEFLTNLHGSAEPEMDVLYAHLQKMRGAPDLEDDFSIVKVDFQ